MIEGERNEGLCGSGPWGKSDISVTPELSEVGVTRQTALGHERSMDFYFN